MPKAIICPSLLSGDFAYLAEECNKILFAGADWLHMDVMDGHFVPNLTIGAPVIKNLRKHTKGFLDCHLMISDPRKYIPDFVDAGADSVTFHVETMSSSELHKYVTEFDDSKCKLSLAIKPKTGVDELLELMKDEAFRKKIFMVLIMTVEPGFGGQKFQPENLEKSEKLRKAFPELLIQVDGGLAVDNVEVAAAKGANVIVAGSSIFSAQNRSAYMQELREKVNKHT